MLAEIAGVFVVVLSILCLTFLVQRILVITEWAVNRGVGFLDILRMVIYIFPMLLMVMIPLVTLFGILIAVGRLSSDNEITILKSSGMGLHQLVFPVFIFSFLALLLTLFVSLFVLPEANRKSRELQYAIVKTRTESALPSRTFIEFLDDQYFYVREKGPGGLKGLLIFHDLDDDEGGHVPMRTRLVTAREAEFENDPDRLENFLVLKDGRVYLHDLERERDQVVRFESSLARLNLKGPSRFLDPRTRSSESDLPEMLLAMRMFNEALESRPEDDPERDRIENAITVFRLALYERLAFPLACLLLALWALPLGLQDPRSGRLRPVILSIIVSMLFYYSIIVGKALALKGTISAISAVWVPCILFLVVGIYLFDLKRRERAIPVLSLLDESVFLAQEFFRKRKAKTRGDLE
jgi:lipopolysaccharide export system permease protein